MDDAMSPTADRGETAFALSPVQRRWAGHYVMDRSKTWGNIWWPVELPGRFDRRALENAIAATWAEHDVLRTTFPYRNGSVVQRVATAVEVPLTIRYAPQDRWAQAKDSVVREELARRIDLDNGPITRFVVLLDPATELGTAMFFTHHLLIDGQSMIKLAGLVEQGYRSAPAPSTERRPGYREFADAMNRREQSTAAEPVRQFWLDLLESPIPDTLPVPGDAAALPARGAAVQTVLSGEVGTAVKGWAEHLGVRTTSIYYYLFFRALSRVTGQRDLVIGTPLGGRDHTTRDALGMFINLVPVRFETDDGATVDKEVLRFDGLLSQAIDNQWWQLDRIASDLRLVPLPGRFPITDTFFSKLAMPKPCGQAVTGELRHRDLPVDVRFHAMFYVYAYPDAVELELRYRKHLFDRSFVINLVGAYQDALTESLPS